MRIAQVSPLYESVPPRRYGGTERVVSYLTEELVRRGHDVTLFASGDSLTRATFVPTGERALRLSGAEEEIAPHVLQLERVLDPRRAFDVVHFHCGTLHFPLVRRLRMAHVTTMHGRLDVPETNALLEEFTDLPLVSISDDQRAPVPRARFVATIHHGLPRDLLPFSERPLGYLAFLGRLSREKRCDRAIRVARAAGLPLRIAAKIGRGDVAFFEREVAPLLHGGGVEYVGEIGDAEKARFLGGAAALLMPIDWPEPFGLVMIEAMACGTPVIAWRRGSVPEIVDDGVTGFIVDDEAQAVDAVARAAALSRRRVREVFERRFSVERMVDDHLELYQRLIEEHAREEEEAARPPAREDARAPRAWR